MLLKCQRDKKGYVPLIRIRFEDRKIRNRKKSNVDIIIYVIDVYAVVFFLKFFIYITLSTNMESEKDEKIRVYIWDK